MVNESISGIFLETLSVLASVPGVGTLIKILQTVGILVIAYLIFLFIKGILQYKGFSRIKRIENKLEEVCDILSHIDKNLTGSAKQKDKKKR